MSCPRCIQGFILPSEPTGTVQPDFHNAYLVPAPNGKPSRCAVLLFTDVFGLPLRNPMIMADAIAKELRCDVWVPDYFKGKPPMPLTTMIPDRAGVKTSLWDWVKFARVLLRNLPALINSRPAVVDKRLASLFALLKEKKSYEKIGAVGYCFGGISVVIDPGLTQSVKGVKQVMTTLGGMTAACLGSTKYLNSIIIIHPGPISDSVLKFISIPMAWACAEEDAFWPESERNEAEAVFTARKDTEKFVDYEFKIYKGTAHGFASRPNLELPEIKAAHEQALEQAIAWFQKTLIVSEPVKETTEG